MKFYNDAKGSNCIKNISAAKEEKKKLNPLLFKMGTVWCNVTHSPDSRINLPAIVYSIPQMWSVCCWISDCLSNSYLFSNNSNSEFLKFLN